MNFSLSRVSTGISVLAFIAAMGVSQRGLAQSAEAANLLNFQTTDVRGGDVDLSRLEDQWVVVNFWATWCKPCLKEIPDLSDLHTRRTDVTLIGLTFEETTSEDVAQFLEKHPASYPIGLVDVFNPPEQFGTPRVLPTTLLISPDGVQKKRFIGPVTSEMIEAEIAQHQ
ncbi:MAG: TlpA family protein disulfide reductase [Lysobacterales bacterium]